MQNQMIQKQNIMNNQGNQNSNSGWGNNQTPKPIIEENLYPSIDPNNWGSGQNQGNNNNGSNNQGWNANNQNNNNNQGWGNNAQTNTSNLQMKWTPIDQNNPQHQVFVKINSTPWLK